MREPPARNRIYGLAAEFKRAEDLVAASRRAAASGYREFEAYSPFPIDELAEAIGFREAWVPLATLLGGIAGAAVGYGMQVYTNLDFPIDIGGRPLIAPPAFALITFEVMVLFAVISSVASMLLLNRLPKLHHPLFEIERFRLASIDRFFLVIQSNDPRFDAGQARRFLDELGPVRVDEVPFAEAPE
jgi:hypothetical protein